MREAVALSLAACCAERILAFVIPDAAFLRQPFDLRGAPRKFVDDTVRCSADFPALRRPLDAVAERGQLVRQPGMKRASLYGASFLIPAHEAAFQRSSTKSRVALKAKQ